MLVTSDPGGGLSGKHRGRTAASGADGRTKGTMPSCLAGARLDTCTAKSARRDACSSGWSGSRSRRRSTTWSRNVVAGGGSTETRSSALSGVRQSRLGPVPYRGGGSSSRLSGYAVSPNSTKSDGVLRDLSACRFGAPQPPSGVVRRANRKGQTLLAHSARHGRAEPLLGLFTSVQVDVDLAVTPVEEWPITVERSWDDITADNAPMSSSRRADSVALGERPLGDVERHDAFLKARTARSTLFRSRTSRTSSSSWRPLTYLFHDGKGY